jgi:hypothetical protein
MNRDRLLADAKAKALALAEGYQPPAPPVFRLPGAGGKAALDLAVQGFRARGLATPYDEVVAGKLAHVLSGGDFDMVDTVTEADLLAMERAQFVTLVRDPRSMARIEAMLTTGKPFAINVERATARRRGLSCKSTPLPCAICVSCFMSCIRAMASAICPAMRTSPPT